MDLGRHDGAMRLRGPPGIRSHEEVGSCGVACWKTPAPSLGGADVLCEVFSRTRRIAPSGSGSELQRIPTWYRNCRASRVLQHFLVSRSIGILDLSQTFQDLPAQVLLGFAAKERV
jgi:hypothetical protein